jgi:hypothetical protein
MKQPSSPSPPPSGFPYSPQDALDFMQKMWNPMGVPVPGFGMPGAPQPGAPDGAAAMPGAMPFFNPAAIFAAMDPEQVQRKIDELRVIEGWLEMTLNMMQMSIKTMELQKASLETMRGGQSASSGADAKPRQSRGKA